MDCSCTGKEERLGRDNGPIPIALAESAGHLCLVTSSGDNVHRKLNVFQK